MSRKFTSTIAGASIFISLIGLLSRGLGFVREIIFANNFGLEKEFDLYLVGAVLPITINSIILYVGQNYFVPRFQKVGSTQPSSLRNYFNHSFFLFIGIGFLVSIILLVGSDLIINSYMHLASSESREIALIVFRIFLITIPFSSAISIFSASTQAVYEFKYPAISILFLNASLITLLVFFSSQFGVYIIPVGYVVGTILQFIYLLYISRRIIKPKLFDKKREYDQPMSAASSTLIIIILIESISQLYSLFDRYFYGEISAGGIAALNYALIIWIQPITIFSLSLATAVFPIISNAINDYSQEKIERIYYDNISVNTFIFIPLAFILFVFGDTIIKILFERGKFVAESTAITFNVLRYYSISLVFFSVYAVLNKIFYSLGKIKLLLGITIVGLLIKLIFNFLLINLEQDGLALSTSISYIYFFLASYIVLNIKLKIKNLYLFFKDFLFLGVICIISFFIVHSLFRIIRLNTFYESILMIISFISLYLINSVLLKHDSIGILKRVKNNFKYSQN